MTSNLEIDIYSLEKECATNPQELYDAGMAYAEANYAYAAAKMERELMEAETNQNVRADPKKYKLEKITENAISNTVTTDKNVIKAKNKEMAAYYEMEKARAMRDAVSQKASLLKQEVTLWVTNYYADASEGSIEEAVTSRRSKQNKE